MLTPVLDSKVCAECKNCCAFQKESIWENPRLSKKHLDFLKTKDNSMFLESGSHYFAKYDYTNGALTCTCPFLDDKNGCKFPNDLKPFDCKLWPLRVMKFDNELYITLYNSCPAFNDKTKIAKLKEYVKNDLLDLIEKEIKTNPDIIKEFHKNYIKLIKIKTKL